MKLILKSKKGALSLSINAIVVLIIAIVFLGLALAFTRNLLTQSSDKLVTGIDNVDLQNPADADHPITVDAALEVKVNGKKTVKISFYNAGSQIGNAIPYFTGCVNEDGEAQGSKVPSLAAIPADVSSNQETRFQTTLKANNLTTVGNYICNLRVGNSTVTGANLQVPVKITS